MKYKRIPSALHNFGHSFVSLMNYIDDAYVADLLEEMARAQESHEICISFVTNEIIATKLKIDERVRKSVSTYSNWLPKLLASHQIDPGRVSEITLRYRLVNIGREVIVGAKDDRNRIYKVFVRQAL